MNYYVGIIKSNGTMRLITDMDAEHNFAMWDDDKTPYNFESEKYAEETVNGLVFNGYTAMLVTAQFEITKQIN